VPFANVGDVDGGLVAYGEFVVAAGSTSVAFEAVDAALHGVALLVDVGVEGRPPFNPFLRRLSAWSTLIAMAALMPRRLTMPVLAIGAEYSTGEGVGAAMKLAANDVQSLAIPGIGLWVAEEAPEELLTALTAFLAPYRDAEAAAHKTHEMSAHT
jgi:pimeloyl-ACP methyl ester carboxylesterase